WNFGDTATSYYTNASHSFSYEDSFNVKMYALSDYGCEDSVSKMVYVFPPKADFEITDSAQCFLGNNFEFINKTGQAYGTINYHWFFGDGDTSTINDTVYHSYSNTDTFEVTLIATSNFGCADILTKQLIVHPMPQVDFSINDSVQCFNENNFQFLNLTTFTQVSSLDYAWNFGDSTFSTDTNINHIYQKADTFKVKLIATSNQGCSDTAIKNVIVLESPKTKISVLDSAQCLNENSFTFLNPSDSLNLNVSKTWHFGDNNTSNTDTATHIYLIADTFNVVLIEETNQGCRDTATKEIIVHPSPVTDFSVNDSSQCFNENHFQFTNLTAFQNPLGLNYIWDFGNGSTSTDSNGQMKYSSFDTFDVRLVAISPLGCTDTIVKKVYVLESPKADFSVNDSSQCFNENSFQFTNLTAFQNLLGLNYSWDFGNDSSSTDSNGQMTYLNFDTFSVQLISTSNLGCADTATKSIFVNPNPKADFSVNDSVQCLNENSFEFFNLTAFQNLLGLNYNWDFGNGSTSTDSNEQLKYSSFDTFDVKLVATSTLGCKDSITKNVIV
ncbi:MAG: PKD domain-containing protein, partial [Bacteroidota bacterium]|nr:PKD domain-containing protein [Bacteroidota bacterium]